MSNIVLGEHKNLTISDKIKLLSPFYSESTYIQKLETDPEMAKVYKANIVKFWTDLAAAVIFGMIIAGLLESLSSDAKKQAKKDDTFASAFKATLSNYAYLTVRNSSADMDWLSTIGSPMLNWGAFSFDSASRTVKSIGRFITGDQSFYKTITNTTTAGRQARPMFDYLNPDK